MVELFGPSAGWPAFHPVNDTVRGGASTSKLVIAKDSTNAVFSGNLDISTLGGAGFASQAHTFARPLALPASSHLILSFLVPPSVEPHQPTSFVLTLKNDKPARRPDGRRESVLSYEYKFDLRSWLKGDRVAEKPRLVELKVEWDEFVPTYRGREHKGKEVDPGHIVELSFMARSNFGQQHGDYELTLVSLAAHDTPHKHAHRTWLDALWSWLSLSCWLAWFQRLTAGGAALKRRGQIRLPDEEADN